MTSHRVPLLAVLLVVASLVVAGLAAGVAAQETATPSPTATSSAASSVPLGAHVSSFMQASAGQTDGAVKNAMWEAAYENAAEESTRRALVEQRVGALDGELASIQEQRASLRERFRSGDISRTEYRAGLAAIVGQLAAFGDGLEATSERAAEVGVATNRLDELRTTARTIGGQEVAALARDLTDGSPPGRAGVFGDDRPGRSGDPGQGGTNGGDGGSPDDRAQADEQGKPTTTEVSG